MLLDSISLTGISFQSKAKAASMAKRVVPAAVAAAGTVLAAGKSQSDVFVKESPISETDKIMNNNLDNVVFQSASGGTYTNIRFDKGFYTQMSEQQFAFQTGAFGYDLSVKPYDVVKFGQDTAQFVDYKFSGWTNGQTYSPHYFDQISNSKWNRFCYK